MSTPSSVVSSIARPHRTAGPAWPAAAPRRAARVGRPALTRAASPLVLLVVWELASRIGVLSPDVLAAPSAVALGLVDLLLHGQLLTHLAVSVGRVAFGLAISVTLGTALALAAGLSRVGEAVIDAPMQMLRTLPFLGLVPLFILWFGIGQGTKIGLIAFATTFPLYLTLYSGIRGIDAKLLEAGRVFGLRGAGLVWHVVLPGALPSFLLGLRYALGIGWLSLVAVEQVNASAGLGYLINNARDFLRTDVIVACLIVYSLLGLATDLLVRAIERHALAWRPSILAARTAPAAAVPPTGTAGDPPAQPAPTSAAVLRS